MRLLCLACGEETAPTGPLSACPHCGNQGVPADLDDMSSITLSTHELRILTMWADNWATYIEKRHPGSQRVIRTILDRLATQTAAALTLRQEIADVRAAFPDAEVKVHDSRGRETDL
jgi:hypothetical protein